MLPYIFRKMDPSSIADNVVENALSKEEVSFKELWKEQTCVILFLRRSAYEHLVKYGIHYTMFCD